MTCSRISPIVLALAACVPLQARAGQLLPPEQPIPAVIDHYVDLQLESSDVEPAPQADDGTVLRRLTLDIAGRIPTAAEARDYAQSNDPDKKAKLVERLLQSPDYAYHLRNELDAMLMEEYDGGGPWRQYLLEAARENRPWDRMFREMMLGRQDAPKQEAALAFLRERIKNKDDLVNDTSRVFFGVSINCAKCHDHPLVFDWKQDHYYGFYSFFDRTYLTKKKTLAEKYSGQVKFKTTGGEEKRADFMFLTGQTVQEPDVEKSKEQRKKEEQMVKRAMKDANAPLPDPPEFSPRAEFVRVALEESETPYFARSAVNRTWARLIGYGLVHPLDQMHSGNEPSHPDLLAWLTRDLVEHNFDLKRLIRGIVLSETYARSSRWPGEGEPPGPWHFAVAQVRPLSPQQYSLSLHVASTNPNELPLDMKAEDWAKRREQLEKAARGLAGLFEQPSENFQVSVDEALLFSNSERIERDLLQNSGGSLVGYLTGIEDNRQMIEAAFWSVCSRRPAAEEIEAFEGYLAEREDRREAAVKQMVWALLTSPEMRFNY